MMLANSLAWIVVVLNLLVVTGVACVKIKPLTWEWVETPVHIACALQNVFAAAAILALAFPSGKF